MAPRVCVCVALGAFFQPKQWRRRRTCHEELLQTLEFDTEFGCHREIREGCARGPTLTAGPRRFSL